MIRLIQSYQADLLNGEGLRNVYFFSGCSHHCPGCFNPETWDPGTPQSRPWTDEDMKNLIKDSGHSYISGITLTGGDPLFPGNREEILSLVMSYRAYYGSAKTIWVYTGYLWENLLQEFPKILKYIDVLVDGQYIASRRSPEKPWVGSDNQRVIDVPASLYAGSVVLK